MLGERQLFQPFKMRSVWEDWYVDIVRGKVKCLSCETVFAKKPAKMLSHRGYKGPFEIHDRGVSPNNQSNKRQRQTNPNR